ncbi:MAG: hypothetical protein HYR96_03065 [Deltaproteobacteria bacterium]|nr:hypothetical protein [Deltaproteobacteria bacterium]MBI3294080.1 hypothetical protein [Deltaproteobacteria bacterium]
MMADFMHGVNMKRMVMAMVAVFFTYWVTSILIHGVWLEPMYKAAPSLWRTDADMQQHMLWLILGHLVFAKYFTYIFAKGYEGRGLGEGVRYGFVMGALNAAGCLIQYAVSPISGQMIASWVGGGIAQGILCGVVVSLVYKK